MPADDNIVKTRRFMDEVFNKGNVKAAEEFMSVNFVEHDPFPGQALALKASNKACPLFVKPFQTCKFKLTTFSPDGEKVVARSTMMGTHKGTFMNMSPTGKQINVKGIDIVRLSGGKRLNTGVY